MIDKRLMPLEVAARQLRIPSKWLRKEADAGRIPALRADDKFLVDLPTIRDVLLRRAQGASSNIEPETGGDE